MEKPSPHLEGREILSLTRGSGHFLGLWGVRCQVKDNDMTPPGLLWVDARRQWGPIAMRTICILGLSCRETYLTQGEKYLSSAMAFQPSQRRWPAPTQPVLCCPMSVPVSLQAADSQCNSPPCSHPCTSPSILVSLHSCQIFPEKPIRGLIQTPSQWPFSPQHYKRIKNDISLLSGPLWISKAAISDACPFSCCFPLPKIKCCHLKMKFSRSPELLLLFPQPPLHQAKEAQVSQPLHTTPLSLSLHNFSGHVAVPPHSSKMGSPNWDTLLQMWPNWCWVQTDKNCPCLGGHTPPSAFQCAHDHITV